MERNECPRVSLAWREMEPVGEEEGQLVFLSHKSFVSLFYTESSLGNELAGQEGLLGEMTYLGFPHSSKGVTRAKPL
ncbi:UNVERIFIED_CONTAM: hypothetical protein Sradi_6471900 [Sesamum radiatum]|uniref:Uncharacterized protein n=1 Tax=Sesamum radiatum TaxID=300843 RepID=A0AAW2K5A2_SESRA